MKVNSYNAKDIDNFKSVLQGDINTGFRPTIAICFTDYAIDFKILGTYLSNQNIDVLGTTTCGEIYQENCERGSCSILMMELDRTAYHLHLEKFGSDEAETSKKIAQIALEKFDQPALITYAAKLGLNGDSVVKGYKQVLDPNTPIFGGSAGDNLKNEEYIVFCNGTYETNGLVALILDGTKIKVEGNSYSGWQALGKTHVATKAEGNIIYEIDDKPALDLFIEYFGIEESHIVEGMTVETLPGLCPIKVLDKNNRDYMRSPLSYDRDNNSLILGGDVEQGERFKFCPMPDIDTVEKTVNAFKNYSKKHPVAHAVIVNSCIARKLAFGPLIKKEIKEIYDIWKVPTVGFMGMGEFGRQGENKECYFHNVTCSLLTLTEIT